MCWFWKHKWNVKSRIDLETVGFDETGSRYTLQCKICGDVKKKDLI